METTRLSTKGQIVLPKTMRTSRAWGPGTEFTVEETGEGVLLRPAAHFPQTSLEEVAGCLRLPKDGPFVLVAAEVRSGGTDALRGIESCLAESSCAKVIPPSALMASNPMVPSLAVPDSTTPTARSR